MSSAREKIIVRTSIIGILANVILASLKALIGILANSIAIITDAINNLSDALSSIITIIGTKLAGKPPDRNHPYGYGRIEYITSLIVSSIVLYAGITALIESAKKFFYPETPNYQPLTIIILIIGIIIKLVLGLYVKNKGKSVNSDSLVASGADALNDAILSISVLASAIFYMIFQISLESYTGILVSLYIIKTGFELIKESVDNMLGTRVEGKLAKQIKQEALAEKEVKGAFDLILNDYGPDKYLGSIHIEVPDTLSVAEVDKISRRITKRVLEKYGVILHTIGVYSINTKNPKTTEIQTSIQNIIFSHPEVLQMHGFYIDEKNQSISFDIIIDFKAKEREKIYQTIYDEVQEQYPSYTINIILDVDTSD